MSWIFPTVTIVLVCGVFLYVIHRLSVANERMSKFIMVNNSASAYNVSQENIVSTIPQTPDAKYNRYIGAFMSGEIDDVDMKYLGGDREHIIQ